MGGAFCVQRAEPRSGRRFGEPYAGAKSLQRAALWRTICRGKESMEFLPVIG